MEPKLDDTNCGFRRGRSTTEQISTLQQIFEKAWEQAKQRFCRSREIYGRVPREKLWGLLRECGVDGCLMLTIK